MGRLTPLLGNGERTKGTGGVGMEKRFKYFASDFIRVWSSTSCKIAEHVEFQEKKDAPAQGFM